MLPLLLILLMEAIPFLQSQHLPTQIFILAGQSNMAGRGGVSLDPATGNLTWDGVVPPQSQPSPSIFRLTAGLDWVQAREPLHADIDVNKTNGVGPGMNFANAVLSRDPSFGSVGLVPCAIGGTNISQWAKGGVFVRAARAADESGFIRGRRSESHAVVSGGKRCISKDDADAYKGRLIKFFKDLRADVNHPGLRIIQVGLASGEGDFVEEVRKAQFGIKLPNVEIVDAKGLQLEPPEMLHLTTPSQVHLGQMLADKFLGLPSVFSIHMSAPSSSTTRACYSLVLFVCYFFVFLFLIVT